MEPWQREYIIENLPDLLDVTDCNDSVLVRLQAKKVLSQYDVSSLQCKNGYTRNLEMYTILQSRKDSYAALLDVLEKGLQSGAVEILKKGIPASLRSAFLPSATVDASQDQASARPLETDARSFSNYEAEDQIDFVNNINPLRVSVRKPTAPMQFAEDQYRLAPGFKGFALVLNITEFTNKSSNRGGAKLDTQYMTDLWNQLGYRVTTHEGFFTFDQVDTILEEFKSQFLSQSFTEPISCLIYIGSHGSFSKICCSDETEINLFKNVIYKFDAQNCPQLDGMPKIFLIQACQRFQTDAGPPRLETDAMLQTPIDDTIISFSTIPGFVANRDLYLGTWYTYCLAKVVMEEAHHMDLLRMLKKTQDAMRKINADAPQGQLSSYHDMGIKTLYFNMNP